MTQVSYTSLTDIETRRAELLKSIDDSNVKVNELWHSLTRREESAALSPTKRALTLISNSAGVIDGAIFGWKLYRRFGKKKK